MAPMNVFRMSSRLSFIEHHVKIGFSVTHMGLVLESFDETRNSLKINSFWIFTLGNTGFSFLCISFGRTIYIYTIIGKILSKIGKFYNFFAIFPVIYTLKKVLNFFYLIKVI